LPPFRLNQRKAQRAKQVKEQAAVYALREINSRPLLVLRDVIQNNKMKRRKPNVKKSINPFYPLDFNYILRYNA
jgi:hypothetical protein